MFASSIFIRRLLDLLFTTYYDICGNFILLLQLSTFHLSLIRHVYKWYMKLQLACGFPRRHGHHGKDANEIFCLFESLLLSTRLQIIGGNLSSQWRSGAPRRSCRRTSHPISLNFYTLETQWSSCDADAEIFWAIYRHATRARTRGASIRKKI